MSRLPPLVILWLCATSCVQDIQVLSSSAGVVGGKDMSVGLDMDQLLDAEDTDLGVPQPSVSAWDIALSGGALCVVRRGELLCRGANTEGELGQGDTSTYAGFVRVGKAWDWEGVKGGESHFCALNQAGEVWCWGRSSSGQTGNMGSSAPFRVPLPAKATQVALGINHSCALDGDGTWVVLGRQCRESTGRALPGNERAAGKAQGDGRRHEVGGACWGSGSWLRDRSPGPDVVLGQEHPGAGERDRGERACALCGADEA